MPTQRPTRPFFSNFLAAFRAHSTLPQAAQASSSKSTAASAGPSNPSSTSQPSHPRTIAAASKSGATTSALSALHSPPLSRSPGTNPGYMTRESMGAGLGGSTGRRRGSDSSSEGNGWREAGGAEKWYVGGRTAAGEERFFKLGVVRRDRSLDRLSADRMSL